MASLAASSSFLQLPLFLHIIVIVVTGINVARQAQARALAMSRSSLITYVSSPPHSAFTIYTSPYQPPHPYHRHHHHHLHQHMKPQHSQTALVTGHVFCDICKDGQIKEPLKGVTIGVTCWNGKEEQTFYGITNKLGTFKVKLSGCNPQKHGGGKSCRAKLIYPSFKTSCMLPTNLHDGKLGARLQIMSKTPHKLVLFAGPFAYTTPSKNKKCHQKGGHSISPHKHKTRSSHSHKYSSQRENHKSPSCPVHDDCKSKIPPPYDNLESMFYSAQLRKSDLSLIEKKNDAVSPHSQGFKGHPTPIYITSHKDHNSHKNSHSPIFPSFLSSSSH